MAVQKKAKKMVKLPDPQAVVGDLTPTAPPVGGNVNALPTKTKAPSKPVPNSGIKKATAPIKKKVK